ncbi:MAG: cysteine protease [Actinobacteria bacterium]|nr:cysteine protease [Actinomycetota bacterium]
MQGYYFGWLPDFPDLRDYTINKNLISEKVKRAGARYSVKEMALKTGIIDKNSKKKLPAATDLRKWCTPVENQGNLGSCTANAGVGLLEYFENKAYGKYLDGSRLFLYKVSRNLLQKKGDYGSHIRTTMMAMVLFGIPPEKYLPYQVEKFDEEPDSFCYAFAQNFQAAQYFRLDPVGLTKDKVLEQIKINLAASIPSIFGFTVYSSLSQAGKDGKIPFPGLNEKVEGGHAVMAVGYDDKMKITNNNNEEKTTGALLIRNSWGTDWGEKGYGWLPYKYVMDGLAIDWWTLLDNEWIDTGNFAVKE